MSFDSLLVLESPWAADLAANHSVRPFIEGWAALKSIKVTFRTFNARSDLSHWLNEFAKRGSPNVAYIAGHGSGGRLAGLER